MIQPHGAVEIPVGSQQVFHVETRIKEPLGGVPIVVGDPQTGLHQQPGGNPLLDFPVDDTLKRGLVHIEKDAIHKSILIPDGKVLGLGPEPELGGLGGKVGPVRLES